MAQLRASIPIYTHTVACVRVVARAPTAGNAHGMQGCRGVCGLRTKLRPYAVCWVYVSSACSSAPAVVRSSECRLSWQDVHVDASAAFVTRHRGHSQNSSCSAIDMRHSFADGR